jgi:hypothetical protein
MQSRIMQNTMNYLIAPHNLRGSLAVEDAGIYGRK